MKTPERIWVRKIDMKDLVQGQTTFRTYDGPYARYWQEYRAVKKPAKKKGGKKK